MVLQNVYNNKKIIAFRRKPILPRCIHFETRAGQYEGKDKENQDRILLKEVHINNSDYFLCGVFDGHGDNGQNISEYVKQLCVGFFESSFGKFLEYEFGPILGTKMFIEQMFIDVNSKLQQQQDVCFSNDSGTTACIAIIEKGANTMSKVYIANVGDSSLYMIGKNNKNIKTKNHDADNTEEKNRICDIEGIELEDHEDSEHMKGYTYFTDNDGNQFQNTRSLGDIRLENSGLKHEPDIYIYEMDKQYPYIILATDGITDGFVNDDDIFKLLYPDQQIDTFIIAKKLMDHANESWQQDSVDYRDDMSLIVIDTNKIYSNATRQFITLS